MQINVTYDQSVGSLPAGFVAAVTYVVNYFDSVFTNPVTVNIDLGYGEIAGQSLGSGALGESETYFDSAAYSTAVTALKGNEPNASQQAAYATLPGSSPLSGGTLWLTTAGEKALGLLAGNNSAIDGYVGISSTYPFSYSPTATPAANQYYLVGVLEHEFSEVMGRSSLLGDGLGGTISYSVMDLFRYSAPGTRQLGTGGPAYFSINSGNTNLDSWNTNQNGDLGDWAGSAGADSFLAFSPSGQIAGISSTDLTLMNVLGWDLTPPPPPTPVLTVKDVSASRGQVLQASSLFTTTDPNNDPLTYSFYDNTPSATSGHFVVNGVVQAANQLIVLTAAQLAQTTFVAGTQFSDDLFVNVADGANWAGAKEFHVNVPPPPAPVLSAADLTAGHGQVFQAISLFTTTDPNADPLTYSFQDMTPAAASGYFVVNGVVQAAGQLIVLTAAQLAQTTFVAGTQTSDDLFVNVADGPTWAGAKEFHINVPPPPALTAADVSASHGQVLQGSSLFTVANPSNDQLTYAFYDNTPNATSGHFVVNGVLQAANQVILLTASQLAQTTFVAGSRTSDDLFVNVANGTTSSGAPAWVGAKEFHVNVPPPAAPVLTAADIASSPGQVLQGSSLFTATNPNNDALTYASYDNTPSATSGHFVVNGVAQAANTVIMLTAAQLAQTTFVAGSAMSDDLFVNVADGTTASGDPAWVGAKEFHVNVPPPAAPVLTAADVAASHGQALQASSLFTATNPNNDALTYAFYDNTPDATSGRFVVNGVVQAANQVILLTAAQLAQATFVAGSQTSDDLFVNVADGTTSSGAPAWVGAKEFHVNVPAPQGNLPTAPVLTAADVSASHGQVLQASSLFTATNPNNHQLTYAFYDNTPAATSGHFTVNGVVQAANTVIMLTAAQLAQTTFVAGSATSDDLFVNVADGTTSSGDPAWVGAKEFHVNVPVGGGSIAQLSSYGPAPSDSPAGQSGSGSCDAADIYTQRIAQLSNYMASAFSTWGAGQGDSWVGGHAGNTPAQNSFLASPVQQGHD